MNDLGKERKLSAILFADIQGYTAIMQSDEKLGMSTLKQYQNSLSIEVQEHHGQIVKNYGDGSLCLFPSILQALLCAEGLQLRLQEEPKVPLRIGIHLGDVLHVDNDVYGDSVNIASRIESMGVPGSVLFSKSVFEKVKNHRQLNMKSIGYFGFKNIEGPIEVFALANEGLTVPKRSELKGGRKAAEPKRSQSRLMFWSFIGLFAILAAFILFKSLANEDASKVGAQSDTQYKADKNDKSIAVLAFADMSAEQDQQYFSEGISEEILNLLTKIPDLKVISRTSSFSFREKEATTAEIGKMLHVSHILDGSIRKSKDAFRISTQLIEASSEVQIWSETYDRPIDDIFKIQDDIASTVTEQLKVSLMDKAITSKTVNVAAYNLYLEAKQLRDQRNASSDKSAEELIRKSIEVDSNYGPSWAMLSELIFNGAFSYSRYSITEGLSLSVLAAEKAIELDPNNSLGYIAMTTLMRAKNDFKAADSYLKKALEIDPENTDVIYEMASYALDLGNIDEAIHYLEKAISLDPLNYLLRYTLGLHLLWVEDIDGAAKEMSAYLEQNPSSGLGHNFMAQIYANQGRYDEAFHSLEKDKDPYWHLYRKAIISHEAGRLDVSKVALQEFIDQFGDEGWPNIAHVYAVMGNQDEAFRWLNLAFENNDASLMEVLNYPEFKIMYKDQRWGRLIGRLNLPAHHGFDRSF